METVMTKPAYFVALCASFFVLTGCADQQQSLYQWGSYENQVYALYADNGRVPPEAQITQLEADYQKARAANKSVPPGYHAHLGFLYFQVGKPDQALQSLQTEKALFPESTVYMDRLIARIKP
ncbi:MAG: hypothetical protein RL717_150 [Pseudomonadota bacterium]|jgi:hypothetical protein